MTRALHPFAAPIWLVLLASGCERARDGAGADRAADLALPRFSDMSASLGPFRHDKAGSYEKHLPETMGGGGGFIDFDGDGDLDVYLVQSANYPGRPVDPKKTNVLLRQDGDGTFVDVTDTAGVGDPGYGFGCQAGDIENDGDQDLFVTNYGPNVLFENRGDGTFADIRDEAGVADPRWSTSAAFFDADNDGFLDLYVCNYLVYNDDVALECYASDNRTRSYCAPTQFEGEDDALYRNDGHGRFVDVSEEAGVVGFRGKGLGVAAADIDQDGLVDVLVANDTTETLLFRNRGAVDGTPRFEEDALMSEIARSEDGVARAGMGIDVADIDGDELLDVIITNFSGEVNALYLGRDGGRWFEEQSHESGFGAPSFPFLGFGVALSDVDSDGDLDAMVANGHVLDTIERTSGATTYLQRPLFFLRADGRFQDVAEQLGPMFRRGYAGRGLAVGDIDGDLDEDFLLFQVDGRPVFFENETEPTGSVLALRLVGRRSNRDAIGAAVRVVTGGRILLRTIVGGRSYLSAHGRTLLIGVATGSVERVDITWPSGVEQSVERPALNRVLEIVESAD